MFVLCLGIFLSTHKISHFCAHEKIAKHNKKECFFFRLSRMRDVGGFLMELYRVEFFKGFFLCKAQ